MKLNKHLILFVGLFVGLNVILLAVFKKYYLLLLHHTIFYCREMAKTLAIRLPASSGTVVFLFLSLIILTAIIKFIVMVVKIYKMRKNLLENITDNTPLTKLINKMNLESRVLVVNSPKPFAYCFGIQPKIYISTKLVEMLSAGELEVVLRHEKHHLDNRDTLTMMLAGIIESLLPFFPLISDIIRQYRIERELSADGAAGAGVKGNKHLTKVLIKLLKFEPDYSYSAVPAIASMDILEARIKRLTYKTESTAQFSYRNIAVSLASFSFLLFLVLIPINAVEFHTEDHDFMMVCTQAQSCENVCRLTN